MSILAVDVIDAILQREGTTFTDRPDDKGGPTCCGVTLDTYRAYRSPATVSVDDLKRLDPSTARKIYQQVYIDAPGFGQIVDADLKALMVDAGVQHGTQTAIKMLQRAVGVPPDGLLGTVSLSAINAHDARSLKALVCGARIRLYGSIISHDPKLGAAVIAGYNLQAVNAFGWANRIAQFVEVIV